MKVIKIILFLTVVILQANTLAQAQTVGTSNYAIVTVVKSTNPLTIKPKIYVAKGANNTNEVPLKLESSGDNILSNNQEIIKVLSEMESDGWVLVNSNVTPLGDGHRSDINFIFRKK